MGGMCGSIQKLEGIVFKYDVIITNNHIDIWNKSTHYADTTKIKVQKVSYVIKWLL